MSVAGPVVVIYKCRTFTETSQTVKGRRDSARNEVAQLRALPETANTSSASGGGKKRKATYEAELSADDVSEQRCVLWTSISRSTLSCFN